MYSTAVIPARGGSTRLKYKNIHPINGRSLISYTIEAVLASNYFDRIIVSTDAEYIRCEAKKYPEVEIYNREPEFSDKKTTVIDAILDMMTKISESNILGYFLPTCPFRNSSDIKKGVELLNKDVDSVISISQYTEPPQLALHKKNDDIIPMFDNLKIGATNSLYMTKFYKPNGGFYIGHWNRILKNKNFFTGNIKGVEIL